MLVIQALRPDRLQSALETFALKALGLKELTPSSINLKHLHKEQAVEPVLFIVSAGADPSTELEELAKEAVGEGHYHQVGMTRKGGRGNACVPFTAVHCTYTTLGKELQ